MQHVTAGLAVRVTFSLLLLGVFSLLQSCSRGVSQCPAGTAPDTSDAIQSQCSRLETIEDNDTSTTLLCNRLRRVSYVCRPDGEGLREICADYGVDRVTAESVECNPPRPPFDDSSSGNPSACIGECRADYDRCIALYDEDECIEVSRERCMESCTEYYGNSTYRCRRELCLLSSRNNRMMWSGRCREVRTRHTERCQNSRENCAIACQ